MSESDRVVERWTTGHISPAEHGGFVAYGDYLTLKHELLQAQQDAAIQVGEYWISRRGEEYWIEHESGEGMQVFRVNFEKLISDFYKQEF